MTPVVKWVGGKRQLLNQLIQKLPKEYKNYYEVFVGGGALLFNLAPKNPIINDVNEELLAIYKCLKDDNLYKLMLEELNKHNKNHSEIYYYKIRGLDREANFKNEELYKRAGRAIYLNKSCFNGLYRVNSKGFFNVPSGKKEKVNIYNKDNLDEIHNYFKKNNVVILNKDFEEATKNAQFGDFVYFDPPYDNWENKESFTSYSELNFNKDDQRRLAKCFKQLTDRGVKCMLSNHNTPFINELYKGYNIYVVKAKRLVNSNASGRGAIEEVIITNY